MQALVCEDRYTSIRMDKGKSRQVDEPDACTCTCDSGYSSPAHSSTSSSSSSVPGLSYSPSLSGSAADSQEGTFRAALFEDGQDDWNYTSSCCDDAYLPRDRRKALPRTPTQSHPLAASSESPYRPSDGTASQIAKCASKERRKWSDWWKGISSSDLQKRTSEKATKAHPVPYSSEEEDKIHSMVDMQVMPIVSPGDLSETPDPPPTLKDSWEDGCTDTCHLEEASSYSQTPYRILVNTDLYLMSALENVMMERRKIRAPLKQRGYVERLWQCSVSSPLRQSICAA